MRQPFDIQSTFVPALSAITGLLLMAAVDNSMGQDSVEVAPEPAAKPAAEPTAEPAGESTAETATESVTEPAAFSSQQVEVDIAEAITEGRYAAALDLIDSLDSDATGDVFLLRQKAFLLVKLGKYSEALATADKILSLSPSDTYAEFYRAQALAGLEQLQAAAEQLKVVVRSQPESPAAQVLRQEIPEVEQAVLLEAQGKPAELSLVSSGAKRISGRASAGAGYDTNASYVPKGDATDPIGSYYTETNLFFTLTPWDQTRDSLPVSVELDGDVYLSRYLRDPLDDYDYSLVEGTLRLSREMELGGRSLKIGAEGGYRYVWLGRSPFYYQFNVGGLAEYQITPTVQLFAGYEWRPKNFDRESEFPEYYDRDGHEHYGQGGVSVWVWPQCVWLRAGYTFSYEDADGSQLEHRTHGGFGTIYAYLPAGFQLGLNASYGQPDYMKFLPSPQRVDDLWDFSASLRHEFIVKDLDLVFGYRYLRSRSNQDFADYDRHLFTLGLQYGF